MARAFAELNVPAGYRVEAAIAIGRQGRQGNPAGAVCSSANRRTARDPVASFAFEGAFKA